MAGCTRGGAGANVFVMCGWKGAEEMDEERDVGVAFQSPPVEVARGPVGMAAGTGGVCADGVGDGAGCGRLGAPPHVGSGRRSLNEPRPPAPLGIKPPRAGGGL